MNKFFFILFSIALFPLFSLAQDKPSRIFAIEVDPIAYVLNGYSIHGIYEYNKLRFDIGVFGIEKPDFYLNNRDFTTNTIGVGLKVNYFLNPSKTWFVGIGIGWLKDNIKHKLSLQSGSLQVASLGVHTGLRYNLFKTKFYLSPWISFDYNIPLNINRYEEDYNTTGFSVFPAIHIGYKF